MNTEKKFEDLLKAADKIADLYDKETLSDDDVDNIINMLDNECPDPSQSFPSNNGVEINENTDPSQNITDTVLVSSNPITGVLNTIPYEDNNVSEESIDKLLDMKDEDFKKIEIGWDAFVESTKMMYPEITDYDLKNLLNLVNKYRQGIKFPYFNELPEIIKKEINDYANLGAAQHQASQNTLKQIKNMLAKELFDTIITSNYSSKAFTDISKFTVNEINKEFKDLEVSNLSDLKDYEYND